MKIKYILFISVAIFTFLSCEKELDKLPVLGEQESNFYKTAADAVHALTAAYDPLQYNFTNSVYHFRWFIGDFASDDAIKGGSGVTDQPQLEQLSNYQATPNNIHLNAMWTAKYIGIYRCNLVFENVPSIEDELLTDEIKARLLAEARFLRAYYYYDLVSVFGNVPLVDRTLNPSEYNQPNAPEGEVWAFLEQDLIDAIADLPLKSQYPISDLGRATKGAAQGLLLRAYLYQEKWTEAQTVAEQIVESGEYNLNADYEDIFNKAGENGPGSVFEIQRSPLGGGYWGSVNGANEGNLTNIYQIARGAFGGFGFNLPTQDFVDEFETGDIRLNASVFMVGDTMGDRGVFTKAATGFDHDYYAKKYFVSRSEHEEINVGDPLMNGESNDRIIRYADVLLMHAEAAYHNGQEDVARTSLNAVRERASRTSAQALPEITATGTALLDAIYHERRVELGLEGLRFFDVVRQNRGTEVFGGLGFVSNNRLHPIPQQQIDLSNGVLLQNPGY